MPMIMSRESDQSTSDLTIAMYALCLVGLYLTSMTKRTHDHARPPGATSSTTGTRQVYIVNTTARAFLELSLLFGP